MIRFVDGHHLRNIELTLLPKSMHMTASVLPGKVHDEKTCCNVESVIAMGFLHRHEADVFDEAMDQDPVVEIADDGISGQEHQGRFESISVSVLRG